MSTKPRPACTECDAPEAKILTLFTRTPYCGQYCLAEGQLKYVRIAIRMAEEGIHG